MAKIESCEACGVPLMIGRDLRWNDNGVISGRNFPQYRWVFYQANIIDNLLNGVEKLVGKPIGNIVIESRRRETRRFIERSFPFEVRNTPILEEPDMEANGFPFNRVVAETVSGIRKELTEIGDNTYKVTAYPGDHPAELKEKLKRKRYDFKPGDMVFERCPECGVPLDLSRYRWDLEEGIITDTYTQRRTAVPGSSAVEAALDDLEMEQGESIPEVVIEAQRRFVKSRARKDDWRKSGATYRSLAALRGPGNITGFEVDEKHLTTTIENSCLHLLTVGMAQALFETAMGIEASAYEWELVEYGDLNITVRA